MLNNKIRRNTERAREDWLDKQLDAEGNTHQLYEVVHRCHKERRQTIQNNSILSKGDKLLVHSLEIAGRWQQHIEELYRGKNKPPEVPVGFTVESPSILERNVHWQGSRHR